MEYLLKCEIYARLMAVLDCVEDRNTDFMFIRLEANLVIVTNNQIMVVQRTDHINPTTPIHLAANQELRDVCSKEAPYNSDIKIINNEALGYSAATTTYGFTLHNAVLPLGDNARIHNWRSCLADPPDKPSTRHMVWNAEDITNLCKASPSGVLVFAQNIDGQVPTPIRDANDESWLGIMMPGVQEPVLPARLPEWL